MEGAQMCEKIAIFDKYHLNNHQTHHGLAPASHRHFIPVLTAGRQSRRLRDRPTDKPENGGSSIFHRRTESVEPAAD